MFMLVGIYDWFCFFLFWIYEEKSKSENHIWWRNLCYPTSCRRRGQILHPLASSERSRHRAKDKSPATKMASPKKWKQSELEQFGPGWQVLLHGISMCTKQNYICNIPVHGSERLRMRVISFLEVFSWIFNWCRSQIAPSKAAMPARVGTCPSVLRFGTLLFAGISCRSALAWDICTD